MTRIFLFPLCLFRPFSFCKDRKCSSYVLPLPIVLKPIIYIVSADVFRWLAGNSTKRLDIMAQYWQLVAEPDDPRSGDFGYSKEEMQRFGAQEGLDVYKAIENAADRNIRVRCLSEF